MSSIKNDRRATITFLDGKVREFEYVRDLSAKDPYCVVFVNDSDEKLTAYHRAIQTIDVVPLDA